VDGEDKEAVFDRWESIQGQRAEATTKSEVKIAISRQLNAKRSSKI